MVSKEADSVVGLYLSQQVNKAGVVAKPVYGDQPSLLIGLLSWARLLGLSVIAAGKSSANDFVYDRTHETVSWRGEAIALPDFADVWVLPERGVKETVEARSEMLWAFPQRTVPDLCEMGVVCNHSDLLPDCPTFHAPHARTLEVSEILKTIDDGGILERTGRIDVFNCLRRLDEQSFAGGVFIVVECTDAETWQVLKEKGIPVSRAGGRALPYNPSHLLGVEVPASVLSVCLLGYGTGPPNVEHKVDLLARANRNWSTGKVLTITYQHHHEVAGFEPFLMPPAPLSEGAPLPYYMATGRTLVQNVAKGEVITRSMVATTNDSILWRTRDEMDRMR